MENNSPEVENNSKETPTKPTIIPTVGRVVHFRKDRQQGQPFAAIVVSVHGDDCVNLAIFDANGMPFSRTSVPLLQGDAEPPEIGGYAEWMPYQKGQAAKTERLEAMMSASQPLGLTAVGAEANETAQQPPVAA